MATKRLFRSRTDRAVAGIFGGLGHYFNVDPVLLRVVWLLFFVITGIFPGLIVYIIAIFIIPLEPETQTVYTQPASDSRADQ
jgi:phage shock protein C